MRPGRMRSQHYNTTSYIANGPRRRYRSLANLLESPIAVLIVFALAWLLTR
jgi:hypothetical protein